MTNAIYPSLMCADFSKIGKEIQQLEAAGSDMFHMDIMDGSFVPNFALGVEDFKAVKKLANIPLDAHLMIQNPDNYVTLFKSLGAAEIDFHFEADQHPAKTLKHIKEENMLAGLAINPGTSVATIETLLPIVDYVLVMTVNPGFAGQSFLDFVIPKIDQLTSLKERNHFKINVDGAISPKRISQLSQHGVDNFVVGTSSLFGKDKPYVDIIPELKREN
ncbi:ribulose-phosphate 3-epimerase (plasmid) [Lactiplantibacillus plantarum]|uniref:ribulose-phosphate 3-epimerase n=1 Tax=Lactiplantibacillus plantarum TaxID=1590 RepID=UPI000FF8B8A2|nr:ribulose-phosphate 3-epimerase [Lactiplantibacillus plantarum]QAS31480.1 ribulose-phosphate 3-epimerase [Lactiplantibacillus plantarum]